MKQVWQRGAIAFKTFSGPSEFVYEIPQYLLLRSLLRCVLLKLFRPGTLGDLRNAFPRPKTNGGNKLSGRFASRAFLVTLKGLDDSQMGHRNHLLFTGSQSKKGVVSQFLVGSHMAWSTLSFSFHKMKQNSSNFDPEG